MPTTIFALSASDLQAKLHPASSQASFRIGDAAGDDLDVAGAEAILSIAEDRVLSHVPERYRRLLRAVDGEVVVRRGTLGQNTLQLGLAPVVTGSLRLYLNYPDGASWGERAVDPDPAVSSARGASGTIFPVPASAFALTTGTGAVSLSGWSLEDGDRVTATYRHTSTGFAFLRDAALGYAAIEVARRYGFLRADGGDSQRFMDWNIDLDRYMERLAKGQAPGISGLDSLELVGSRPRGGTAARLSKLLGGVR